MCADDFNALVEACDGDRCLAVNADPSHCWEGESWETRFLKVAPRVYACHVKNFVIRPGLPLRMRERGWQKRAMQFVDIPTGDLNMTRYVELLIHIGYPQRYCAVMKTGHRPADRGGRKRLPRPGQDQRQRHRLRARQSLLPAGRRFV